MMVLQLGCEVDRPIAEVRNLFGMLIGPARVLRVRLMGGVDASRREAALEAVS